MYVSIGKNREQARALKRVIDAHRTYGFRAITRVANDVMINLLGIHELPAFVYLGDYPDDTSNVHIIFQGNTDPDNNQLAVIDYELKAIEDSIATQQPEILSRDQACIIGVIRDQDTDEPLYSADISFEYVKSDPKHAFQGGTVTDLNGRFTIRTIKEGSIALTVTMKGYKSLEQRLHANGTSMELEIHLDPQAGTSRPKRLFGRFSGVMSLEFENNQFILDEETVARYFDDQQKIVCWVDLAPEVTDIFESNVSYEILCEGVLHGPGAYGHLSMSSHYLWIEKIIRFV